MPFCDLLRQSATAEALCGRIRLIVFGSADVSTCRGLTETITRPHGSTLTETVDGALTSTTVSCPSAFIRLLNRVDTVSLRQELANSKSMSAWHSHSSGHQHARSWSRSVPTCSRIALRKTLRRRFDSGVQGNQCLSRRHDRAISPLDSHRPNDSALLNGLPKIVGRPTYTAFGGMHQPFVRFRWIRFGD